MAFEGVPRKKVRQESEEDFSPVNDNEVFEKGPSTKSTRSRTTRARPKARALGILGDNDPAKILNRKGLIDLATVNRRRARRKKELGIAPKKKRKSTVRLKNVALIAAAVASAPMENVSRNTTPLSELTSAQTEQYRAPEPLPIPFENAVRYARSAADVTGVPAALILAVLEQETDFGKNIGGCYLSDPSTGAGTTIDGTPVNNVMNPKRDTEAFVDQMRSLSRDPFHTPVSCPIPGLGWGGAMGYAQILSSTAEAGIAEQVARALHRTFDPFDPEAAIMAIGFVLQDNGATDETHGAHAAAAKYYAGGRWRQAPGQQYAEQVLARMPEMEARIRTIVAPPNISDRPVGMDSPFS